MNISSFVLPSIALGAAALLILPGADSKAFTFTGAILNLGQRDFRVRNNFADAATNNNVTTHPMFPGQTGVFMAAWKGAAEWGSELHGTGAGDPSQGMLGSGGANFDAFWAGRATAVGNVGQNIVSATTGCASGVLAFAESSASLGWRIRFCDDQWVFSDGPGGPGSQIDFQAIMCHEYGHALGLGHSADTAATMFFSYGGGTGTRSINADDMAGIQALYGVKAANKPTICRTSASGGVLTITGTGFDPTNNTVWFRSAAVTTPGTNAIVSVGGVASSAGGTRIDLNIPGAAGVGDIAVRLPGGSNTYRLLSNCFPTDLVGTIDADCGFLVSDASPSTVDALVPGTDQFLTISGVDLDLVTQITLEPSTVIPASSWTIVNSSTITIDLPTADALGVNTLTFDAGGESGSIDITVVTGSDPVLQMGTGDALNPVANGETLMATLSGTPGDSHRIYYSPSNIPSSFVLANFLIGNNFTELFVAATVTIGANGIGTFSAPLLYTAPSAPFFIQSLNLTGGAMPEFAISNLQSLTLNP